MQDSKSIAEISRLVEQKEPTKRLQQEVAELIVPYLQDMEGTQSDKFVLSPGHYSGSGKTDLEVFSRGMFSHMVGGDVDWIEAGIFGEYDIMQDPASQEFFEMLRLDLMDELYNNGWFDHVKPSLEYGAGLGTDVITITGDYMKNRIDVLHWHPGDVFIGEDGAGKIDRLALRSRANAHDLAEMKDIMLTDAMKLELKKPRAATKEKTMWMYWRRLDDDQENLNPNMRWRYQLLDKGGEVFNESPMHSLPGPVWRFERLPRTAYGICPGIKIYRDLMQSNKIQRLLMQEAEVRVNPPIWIPNRGSKDIYMEPGSLNYVDTPGGGNEIPRRLIDVADMAPAAQLKAEIDRLSRIHFYTEFFMQLTGSTNRKTSTEVQGLMMESGAQVTSVVDSFERGYLNPSIKRTLGVMSEQGRLRDPSAKVAQYIKANKSKGMGIRFIGPLAKSRRWMYSIGQDMRMIQEMVVPIAQVDPGAIDYINIQNLFERGNQFMSGGRAVVRTQEEVDQIRADRQQMQMAQMQANMAQEALKTTKAPEAGSPSEAVMQQA